MPVPESKLKHFYIPDEQSIYLLSHKDARKLKDWINLCIEQLELLGYQRIELIGKGAFGFVFGGISERGEQLVFKFSRINLPQHVQDRLEDEAYMLSQVDHPHVPALEEFQRIRKQAIMVMQRARGEDLEEFSLKQGPLSARLVVKIAVQLGQLLKHLRSQTYQGQPRPIVHGDIKPSNLVFDPQTEQVSLIDWGSSVFAQLDANGQFISTSVMDLMSADLQQTNARLGDVYYIGEEQLNGALSSPRFDEQGVASTLYALASGQSCRFGRHVIRPCSLGLPKEVALTLEAMMSSDAEQRRQGGDYFVRNSHYWRNIKFSSSLEQLEYVPDIPCWVHESDKLIDTVVYSSRKSFLREEGKDAELRYINDAQFERYYKNYMQGMGETEKAFVSAVSRLGKYPVVGGMAVRWHPEGVYIDSSLNLYEPALRRSFEISVNHVVTLARAIHRVGVFKSCMFNARDTLHLDRSGPDVPFLPEADTRIPYEVSSISLVEEQTQMHSYFEDGDDPDELLQLPQSMLEILSELNTIHHTGCIIFEALEHNLKLHSYYRLLDHSQEARFQHLLQQVVAHISLIDGLGISGFMKLPYKDTRYFEHKMALPDKFYPRDPMTQA
ncbi:Non-specific serine/threonine protein kinase [Saliniradius amylolyticus]|uniref:Non-specific serine/threonine protein kinase n=1 Tax=Saliniradius amylolyticus TaxID=2183582 RepID=A0A2S2E4E3_9ALTE|nr:protein kinase [Saliniradius amylolyticus]AWL11877.1 Non-specific serine/threonine protein kinase [Saliniradius amylolyticus]